MQVSVNEENWSNFRDSLNSDLTRQIYEQCLNRFLLYCDSDLESMLKLEPQKITNLIIKYISELRISFQYKNQILCAIKHACEMNDVLLNWAKIKKFNKHEKTDNAINGKDRPYTHKEIQQILEVHELEFRTRPKDCSICRRIAHVFFYTQESTYLCRKCLDFVLGKF